MFLVNSAHENEYAWNTKIENNIIIFQYYYHIIIILKLSLWNILKYSASFIVSILLITFSHIRKL